MAPKDAKEKKYRPEAIKETCDLTAERGCKIYYEISGPTRKEWQQENEEFCFMIPGSAADLRRTTDKQYINLSALFVKLMIYDHRNTGQSSKKDEPVTMEDYADDAAALLKKVVPERLPCNIVGVSFGGMIAQHLAIRHPDVVKKLVLCCCATGGEGGMSYPIHEWYTPGITMEDRVHKKLAQANTDRDEKWRADPKSSYPMVYALLTKDEKIGDDDPLKDKGVDRQLAARKEHNTWDKIEQLKDMEVLCCSSGLDNITPPALVEKMANKIGAEKKLDFGWGHPFIAADENAFPYVNDWLRAPPKKKAAKSSAPAKPEAPRELAYWEIVGGADKGGILVRTGEEMSSAAADSRLSTGALVKELELKGDRLQYELPDSLRVQFDGPKVGWVSIKLANGKELAVKTDKRP